MQLLKILLSVGLASTEDFISASNIQILTSARLEINVNIWISLHFKFARGRKNRELPKILSN